MIIVIRRSHMFTWDSDIEITRGKDIMENSNPSISVSEFVLNFVCFLVLIAATGVIWLLFR
jgi:hypothetical protein